MNALRVLQVVHGFPPDDQAGAELCSYYVARELARRGVHSEVFTRTARAAVADFATVRESIDGVQVMRLKMPDDIAGSLRDTYQNDWVRQVFEQELERGFDVVHVHHTLGLSIDLFEAARKSGARVVATLHDFWYLCPRGQRFTPRAHLCAEIEPWRCSLCIAKKRAKYAWNALRGKRIRPSADTQRDSSARQAGASAQDLTADDGRRGVVRYLVDNLHRTPILDRTQRILSQLNQAHVCVAPSQFLLADYQRHGLVVPGEHLENGVDDAWVAGFQALVEPHRPLRFGFMGSFLPSKGIDLLVDAFQEMPHDGPTLELFGTSPWDGGRLFEELRYRNRHPGVHFHGAFAHSKLPEILKEIDALVVPSRWYENAPLTLDEAALARIPVVAAGHGGMREIVERRQNGLLFHPDDRADLTRTLKQFTTDPDLWSRLREPRVPVMTIGRQVDRLLEIYGGEETEARSQ